jgi:hypothetical protein
MVKSRNLSLISQLKKRLFGGPGSSSPALRQSVRDKVASEVRTGRSSSLDQPEIDGYIEKLSRNAYQITDEDLENLAAKGHSQDLIFELTLAAAFTAGTTRLDIVTEMLREEV